MACLEHACNDCDEVWFDNEQGSACPKCESRSSSVWFDEDFGCFEEEEEEDG